MSSIVQSMAKEGSVLGGVLLIAGSCIGAGMLALPIITGIGGFFPAISMFLIAWLFMTTTALLLLEANLTLGYELSLVSIAEQTLGKTGKWLSWILFAFLFYSLGVAYIAASGSIVQEIGFDLTGKMLPAWIGSLFFTVIFGVVIYIGTKPVDYLNRLLMVGLIISYCALVFLGSYHIDYALLQVHAWKYSFAALPVLVISFGFHNMIPSLAQYFKGDVRRLRQTVIIGSLIPLFIYLIWEAVMLGIIPVNGREGLLKALDQGQAATQVLREVIGKSWICTMGHAFALFAIITSFLAQSLSLVDFLADGLRIPKVKAWRWGLILLTLVPPFFLALIYPGIFIKALNLAGGFSAVVLFGIFPALMVWILRYRRKSSLAHVLPAGRVLLMGILFIAGAIFLLELAQELGLPLLPTLGGSA